MFIILYKMRIQQLNVDIEKDNSGSLSEGQNVKKGNDIMNRICDDKIIGRVNEFDCVEQSVCHFKMKTYVEKINKIPGSK